MVLKRLLSNDFWPQRTVFFSPRCHGHSSLPPPQQHHDVDGEAAIMLFLYSNLHFWPLLCLELLLQSPLSLLLYGQSI